MDCFHAEYPLIKMIEVVENSYFMVDESEYSKKKYMLLGRKEEQVAQGQYMVSDTLCPALSDCELELGEAGQRPRRGRSPVEHRGTFVRPALPG